MKSNPTPEALALVRKAVEGCLVGEIDPFEKIARALDLDGLLEAKRERDQLLKEPRLVYESKHERWVLLPRGFVYIHSGMDAAYALKVEADAAMEAGDE